MDTARAPGSEIVVGEDGRRLRVVRQGDGPLVVMVHGFPETWISWRHQLPTLAAAGYTAVALECRGYGESYSPRRVAAYTLRLLAADIALVVTRFGGGQGAVLIGHDWGGTQVHAAAVMHPDLVRAAAFLAYVPGPFADRPPSQIWAERYPDGGFYQSYYFPPGEIEGDFTRDPGAFVRKVLYALSGDRPAAVNGLVRPPGTMRYLDGLPDPDPLPAWLSEENVQAYVASLAASGLVGPINRYRAQDIEIEELAPYRDTRISQPALFIGGAADPGRFVVPGVDRFADPLAWCDQPRGAHVLDGYGHWIQQEAPGPVDALLLAFLAEV